MNQLRGQILSSKFLGLRCENIKKIIETKRYHGKAEGRVYVNSRRRGIRALADPKVNDPGDIIFTGAAALLFKRHRIFFLLGLVKRCFGEYVAQDGDIVFDRFQVTMPSDLQPRTTVTVSEAHIERHQYGLRYLGLARKYLQIWLVDLPLFILFLFVLYLGLLSGLAVFGVNSETLNYPLSYFQWIPDLFTCGTHISLWRVAACAFALGFFWLLWRALEPAIYYSARRSSEKRQRDNS